MEKRRREEEREEDGGRRGERYECDIFRPELGFTPLGVNAECVETVRMGGEEEEKVREEKKK